MTDTDDILPELRKLAMVSRHQPMTYRKLYCSIWHETIFVFLFAQANSHKISPTLYDAVLRHSMSIARARYIELDPGAKSFPQTCIQATLDVLCESFRTREHERTSPTFDHNTINLRVSDTIWYLHTWGVRSPLRLLPKPTSMPANYCPESFPEFRWQFVDDDPGGESIPADQILRHAAAAAGIVFAAASYADFNSPPHLVLLTDDPVFEIIDPPEPPPPPVMRRSAEPDHDDAPVEVSAEAKSPASAASSRAKPMAEAPSRPSGDPRPATPPVAVLAAASDPGPASRPQDDGDESQAHLQQGDPGRAEAPTTKPGHGGTGTGDAAGPGQQGSSASGGATGSAGKSAAASDEDLPQIVTRFAHVNSRHLSYSVRDAIKNTLDDPDSPDRCVIGRGSNLQVTISGDSSGPLIEVRSKTTKSSNVDSSEIDALLSKHVTSNKKLNC